MELSTAAAAVARAKQEQLDARLRETGSLLVAYSGGVDSAYLAARAFRVLGARMLAVTADSASLAEDQRRHAAHVAQVAGFPHEWLATAELDDPRYARNLPDRCYFCKSELFTRLLPLARERGFAHVAYGMIVDDLSDNRPGHRAAQEAGVRGLLAEVGLGKAELRRLSHEMGLPGFDRPASPCLSSRIAHGVAVTRERLARVDAAEAAVRAHGFRELRVRDLGDGARVEVAPAELTRLSDPATAEQVRGAVAAAGFARVELDPRGYRRGALAAAGDGFRRRDHQAPDGLGPKPGV